MVATEGEDKPLKYPVMFQKADAVVVTKADLLAALPEFQLDALRENVARVAPAAALMLVSARTGEGMDAWRGWLEAGRAERGVAAAAS